jgi:mRNA interferase RelE/StbE
LSYEVVYSDEAIKALKKMDKIASGMIASWISKNLIGIDDPRRNGKALTGNLRGIWRYRVGDCRIFAKIDDGKLIILILDVRHKRSAYV